MSIDASRLGSLHPHREGLRALAGRPRLRAFLLFLLFLIVVPVFGAGLEWLWIERLHFVTTAGRPWRPLFFDVWEGSSIVAGVIATSIVARLGPRDWRRLGFDTRHASRQLAIGMVSGLIIITVLVFEITAFGGFARGPLTTNGAGTLLNAAAWLTALLATVSQGRSSCTAPRFSLFLMRSGSGRRR